MAFCAGGGIMDEYRRLALYYAPPSGSTLARLGSAWLGWDAEVGRVLRQPDLPGLPLAPAEIAATPGRYGFHGTLKAPFRLAPGTGAAALDEAVADLAARTAPFSLPRLRLAALGDFLALTPEAPCPRLDALAAACVTELDGFRAPTPAPERDRRAAGLDPEEIALLDRWGYPHVLERFRFHMTLTGALAPADRAAVAEALARHFAPALDEPQRFDDVCLFGETEDGRFRVVRRHPLGGERWSG
jgi:putative phosphonate metabolism protein